MPMTAERLIPTAAAFIQIHGSPDANQFRKKLVCFESGITNFRIFLEASDGLLQQLYL